MQNSIYHIAALILLFRKFTINILLLKDDVLTKGNKSLQDLSCPDMALEKHCRFFLSFSFVIFVSVMHYGSRLSCLYLFFVINCIVTMQCRIIFMHAS